MTTQRTTKKQIEGFRDSRLQDLGRACFRRDISAVAAMGNDKRVELAWWASAAAHRQHRTDWASPWRPGTKQHFAPHVGWGYVMKWILNCPRANNTQGATPPGLNLLHGAAPRLRDWGGPCDPLGKIIAGLFLVAGGGAVFQDNTCHESRVLGEWKRLHSSLVCCARDFPAGVRANIHIVGLVDCACAMVSSATSREITLKPFLKRSSAGDAKGVLTHALKGRVCFGRKGLRRQETGNR